jgi:hypothetical protein
MPSALSRLSKRGWRGLWAGLEMACPLNHGSRVRIGAKSDCEQPQETKACCRCRRRGGFAIGITLDWLPSGRV